VKSRPASAYVVKLEELFGPHRGIDDITVPLREELPRRIDVVEQFIENESAIFFFAFDAR
jgi:hypothetical protein